MTKRYKSEALAAAHEAGLGLAEVGPMSKQTMRAFDEMYLTPVEEMAPEDIRVLRLRENASQAVCAHYFNVTLGLVSQRKRGEKRPRGASLKLLTLVAKNGLGRSREGAHPSRPRPERPRTRLEPTWRLHHGR